MSSECDWRCRGGRLLVRGAHDILPTETHWVASGMWLPDWYERPHQRPDPHADHPGGIADGDFLPGPAPMRGADDGGLHDTLLIATVYSSIDSHGVRSYDCNQAALGRANGHLVVAVGPPQAEAELRAAGCDQFLSNQTMEEGGVLQIPGFEPSKKTTSSAICPASGVVGNVLLQMLLAHIAEVLHHAVRSRSQCMLSRFWLHFVS